MSLTLALSMGCLSPIGHPAPNDYSMQLVTEGLSVSWSSQFNGVGDGIGVLAPIDVIASDGEGLAAQNIQIEFLAGWGGMYLLPEAAIQEVDPPSTEGVNCTPGAEDYDPEVCPWYDESSDRYFELSGSYSGDYRPNYVLAATDEFGRARIWIYVDAMPQTNDGDFSAAQVDVLMGASAGAYVVEPLAE